MEDKNVTYEEFVSRLRQKLYQIIPEDMRLEVRQILKNNSLVMDCLILYNEQYHASPNFPLQKLYQYYLDGQDFDQIASVVYQKWLDSTSQAERLIQKLPEKIHKKRVIYRLINAKRNKQYLQDSPHIPFLDLAIIFYYMIDKAETGIQSIRITNQLMEYWGTNTGALMKMADKNMPRIFPVKYIPLREMFKNVMPPKSELLQETEDEPYILTNEKWINGAAVWVYPNQIEKIAESEQNNLYILPSSIHELLILNDRKGLEHQELLKIVHMVNANCVDTEDFLSDNIYYYDRGKKAISIIKEEQ